MQSDISSVSDQSQTTKKTGLTDTQKITLIYSAKLFVRLMLSAGMSTLATSVYDASKEASMLTKENSVNLASNLTFLILDNCQKGLLDNAFNLTREKKQTPKQVFKSFAEAVVTFVLTAAAGYGISQVNLKEMLTLGLIVLAANLIKAPIEWVTSNYIAHRPVILLKNPSSGDLGRGLLDNEIFSGVESDLENPVGNKRTSDTRNFSEDRSMSSTESTESNYSTSSSCWASLMSFCAKNPSPHGMTPSR